MSNAVFEKTIKNMRKHRDIKLVTTKRRRNYLVWEQNFNTTKFFTVFHRKFISNRNEKNPEIHMTKPAHLEFSILELSKILMYEF